MARTVQITLHSIRYFGDRIGDSFFFFFQLGDWQSSFRKKLEYGVDNPVDKENDHLSLTFVDALPEINLPFAMLAVELDASFAPGNPAIHLKTDDVGLAGETIKIDFREIPTFPWEYLQFLAIDVAGRGGEIGRKAKLELGLHIQITSDLPAPTPGMRVLELYEMGRRGFSGDDLRGIELQGAVLPGIDLSEANLAGGNLESADLYRADLTLAILNEVYATDVVLTHANLSEVNAFSLIINGGNLRYANCSYIRLAAQGYRLQAQNADFSGAEINESEFKEANFSGASFVNARVTRTDFRNADLSFTDFTGAYLENIDYRGANLEGAIGFNVPNTDF